MSCCAATRLNVARLGTSITVVRLVGLILAAASVVTASGLGAAEPPFSFTNQIQPLLEKTCFKCHDADTGKGEVDLTRFKTEEDFTRDPKLLEKLVRLVRDRDMPPPSRRPQPKEPEREMLIDWGQYTLAHIDYDKFPRDPGRVVIHRLSRFEYNNTVRDLFGVTNQPADKFPADGGGGGGFDNNADTLFVPPILLEKYLEAASDVLQAARPETIFISKPRLLTSRAAAARRNIEHVAMRAYRRPVEKAEIDALMALFEQATRRGESFENAVKFSLKAALVSPYFLFRIERDQKTREPHRISSYEMASRLSYFIWSSMPDEELFRLAAQDRLHDTAVIDGQVKRMLRDPKARAFADSFAGQWLRIRDLRTAAQPDPRRFSQFTPSLRDAMYEEAIAFFHALVREDRSLLEVLDANYTFVNEELAKHYGMTNVVGPEFRRVELADGQRGGVLGMGAVLTLTSYPQRTSPVLRGKWVLEELLGMPPPPPPPDAGGLPADGAPRNGLTFRQRLEEHRSKPQCASCHRRMDPLGFGLENFDAIGRWRDKIGSEPVDAKGVMSTGEEFSGPAELKRILLERKDAFAQNVTERMLAYALGRGVEFYDMPTVKRISDLLAKNDYRISKLVTEIARSYPFQYRRPTDQPVAVAAH
jgi:hypothetical protein